MAKNRILIAEDDPYIAETVGVHLELSGYDHTILHDGLAVAAHLGDDHAYDLALLDVMLPGLDGFSLMEHLQKYGIPALYLTAKADVSSRVRGLRLGAEDYLVKPFEMIELLVRMEKILERTGKLEKVLQFGEITIDTMERRVFKSHQEAHLKPLEFDLFVMLVRYKNRTLLRERLLNEIWGVDFFGGTRTVDVHIAQLRKKLGLFSEIVTIPKVGYRLEEH